MMNVLAENSIVVKTDANVAFNAWHKQLQVFRDSFAAQGDNWLTEVAFCDALLAVLDDQPTSLPDDNPYQSTLQQVMAAIADYEKNT